MSIGWADKTDCRCIALPLARSSSICISPSFADMDMYSADMEYRFDWRAERVPSYEDMVFWRDSGWKEDEEAVEALDGV